MCSYTELSDEELIKVAIGYVAAGLPIPSDIENRLRSLELLELLTHPVSADDLD